MNNIEELKRFIYSATVTSGSGSQSFYIDAKSREEADARSANNESDGMYADDSEITDLDALEYEDETTVDDFGDFPLICSACNGSGYYDNDGSPYCGACGGTGKERFQPLAEGNADAE
ncbi:hypothetical protein [Yersinia bercovieri]|uniref:hypothetical protein n=1 Tax=Yersinia bercovieri TaxID=634 RepID=UPI0005DB8BC2|nr:hypothetical protein [Yersinia bercovieri]CNI59837.1 Uncharacterised protein [Yersinia bercovieri]